MYTIQLDENGLNIVFAGLMKLPAEVSYGLLKQLELMAAEKESQERQQEHHQE